MNFLRHSSTVCHNVGGVGDKLSNIAREGSDRFQIIADFDFTMTGYCERGTCFGAIRTYPGFSKEFLANTTKIKNHYLPIHIDYTIPEDVRRVSDLEWLTKVMECFVTEKFNKSLLPDIIDKSECRLREGVAEFLKLAYENKIPVLIFSGGIKEMIDSILIQNGCSYDNISVIANTLRFDQDGMIIGVVEPLITASTKLEVAKGNVYFKDNVKRDQVLLLGDMMTDLKMAECCTYERLLTVGFLNEVKGDNERDYMEAFDLVLKGNQGFEVINDLFKEILGN